MADVPLAECPPGLFLFNGNLGFKSEYKTESMSPPGFWQSDAYVVESGEYFWGGVSDAREREQLIVTPLEPERCQKCYEIFLAPITPTPQPPA